MPSDADNTLTNEDSGDENEEETLDNLLGSQLSARAEFILADKICIGKTKFVSNMNTVYGEPDWIQGNIEMSNRQFSKSINA